MEGELFSLYTNVTFREIIFNAFGQKINNVIGKFLLISL